MTKRRLQFAILVFIGFLWLASPLWAQIATEQVNGHAAVAHEVLVKFRANPSANLAGIQSEHDIATTTPLVHGGTLYRLHSRSKDAATLAQELSLRSDVIYAEPNYIVNTSQVPDDPYFSLLWGMRNTGQPVGGQAGVPGADISAVAAWDVSTGSRNNVIAVVDTGIDYTHPDLAANVWSAPASFTVTIEGVNITCPAGTHGFNAITETCDPMDDFDHGSHVSGTIGASGNNSLGVVGVNWVASIMASKFLDSTGQGTTSGAIDAIEFTIQAKLAFAATSGANVRVLSNSWGGGDFSQALLDEINRANANNMLFVAAAGNNGTDNGASPHYPASYNAPNLIAVAATDNEDQLASFSNYGSSTVHLGAPGVNVYSTIPGGSYEYMSGTSMATPHVSGTAMLVLSVCPLDTTDLKNTLIGTVDPISALATKTITGGRLNANAAIHSCTDAVTVLPRSLTFASQQVGSSSSAATVNLINRQSSALGVSSIAASGDFLVTASTCGNSVAANAQCTISVSFSPTAGGYRTGALTITTNSQNSPQTVALAGTGIGPVNSAPIISPMAINFGSQLVGTTSIPQFVQITNTASTPLTLNISISGDFALLNNCNLVAASSYCYIDITFTPTLGGTRTGALTIVGNDPGSPHTVLLTGQGVATPPAGGFTAIGNMTVSRQDHTATLLNNGQVLIAGGRSEGYIALFSAELYDPLSSTFTATGNMLDALWAHTATLLPNGKVLIAGGYTNGFGSAITNSAELYDPATGTFSATGNMNAVRCYHTATLLNTGKVLIAGGWGMDVALSSAELYDPATGTFTLTGNMTTPQYLHTATLLNDGTVLMAGGGSVGSPIASAEVYNPATGSFTAVGNMLVPRSTHTATLLSSGKVLMASGVWDSPSTSELYDPVSRTFSATGSLVDYSRIFPTGTLLMDNTVLVVGGNYNGASTQAQIYTPSTAAFTLTGPMITGRQEHTATRLNNGQVLVAGGATGGGNYESVPVASAELYTPTQGTGASTTTLTSSPSPSSYGEAVIFTATVSPNSCTGTITFLDGTDSMGAATIGSGGTAVFTTSTLAVATHAITAQYSGSTSCASSSGFVTQIVGPAPLTVTADNQSMTYGGAIPTLTCHVAGAMNGDVITCSATTTSTPTVLGSPFAIVPSASGTALGNYTVTTNIGQLTVGPAALTVTADNQSMTYGTAIPTLTCHVSGAVNGDVITCSATTTSTPTAVGSPFAIVPSVSGTALGNYTITANAGQLTVAKAPLTITAGNVVIPYGGTAPTPACTVTGAVNGDAITCTAVVSGTATVPTASGAALANYSVTAVDGTVTKGQATPNISITCGTFTYSGAPHSCFATAKGVNGVAVSGKFTYSPAQSETAPGTYNITATFASSNANYSNGSPATGSLVINAKSLLVAPTVIDFPSTYIGSASVARIVRIFNDTGAAITFNPATITGLDAGDFTMVDSCSAETLPVVIPYASCTVQVTFKPLDLITSSSLLATLNITAVPSGAPQASLSASVALYGASKPRLVVQPGALVFPSTYLSASSGVQTVTVTNDTGGPVQVSASLSGADPGDFAISQNQCASGTIDNLGTCTVFVTFSPAKISTRIAVLGITAGGITENVSLRGTGVAWLTVSPSPIPTFAAIAVGKSESRIVTVGYNSTIPMDISIVPPGEFAITSAVCTAMVPGTACTYTLTFTPAAAGLRTATMTITGETTNGQVLTWTTSLSGTGLN